MFQDVSIYLLTTAYACIFNVYLRRSYFISRGRFTITHVELKHKIAYNYHQLQR